MMREKFTDESSRHSEWKQKRTLPRRTWLQASITAAGLGSCMGNSPEKISRKEWVSRHNPCLHHLDPFTPLSVGNGEFCFTADITGLQSFPDAYASSFPLCTQSHWGWHRFPLAPGMDPQRFRMTPYDTYGRAVGYPTRSDQQQELYQWLRDNPHRLNLGRIGFRFETSPGVFARPEELRPLDQTLDLWTGTLLSRFRILDQLVVVRTACHPTKDALAVQVQTELMRKGCLHICFEFPYGSPDMGASDWKSPAKHSTTIQQRTKATVLLQRRLDEDSYALQITWSPPAVFAEKMPHTFHLTPEKSATQFEFVCQFSPRAQEFSSLTAREVLTQSERHWRRFWSEGGAVELVGSRDPRSRELERRIVLSQYLTAIQCSGSLPPQETGLTCNSWNGKFHLEMHWWHAVHFALWNRLPLLEKSLDWYRSVLPEARQIAVRQGYQGVRWPKMVGPDGHDSPSPIGPLLVWQQPHPIYYAELCYRSHPTARTLQRFREVVWQSAEFMASFPFFQKEKNRYVLGPPLIPAQENHDPKTTWNATFELSYWRWGLQIAQLWRLRSGLGEHPGWADVIRRLSTLPTKDGLYLAHENCPDTFTLKNADHPSMLGTMGFLPGDDADRETMRRTLHAVLRHWKWDSTWGWDYPLVAMTAARLNEPEIAVDALLMDTPKNRYLPNGHNYQRPNLPLYLPGNGGLLTAIALMAAGWNGSSRQKAPCFPGKGQWQVRWENLIPMLA